MFPVPHMSRVDLSLSSVSLRGSTSISTDSTRLLPAAALHPLRRKNRCADSLTLTSLFAVVMSKLTLLPSTKTYSAVPWA